MKSFRKINVLFLGLTLVFSLVSFSGISTQSYSEATKTELVVNDTKTSTRFSVHFLKVGISIAPLHYSYSNFSFLTFLNTKSSTSTIAFKTFTYKTLSVLTEKRHTESYSCSNNKILYNNFIV